MRPLFVTVFFLIVVPAAWPDDGWSSYTEDENIVAEAGPPPGVEVMSGSVEVLAQEGNPEDPVAGAPGAPGPAGPQGPQGPQGGKGDRGDKGDSADLCQNIPGVQVVPGFKYNAQRYWSFLPKWEKRYLATNRKKQIVCVTLRWIKAHSHR